MVKLVCSIWSSGSRPLFLRWVVMQVALATVSAVVAVRWGSHVHGLALLAIPYVLLIYGYSASRVAQTLNLFDQGRIPLLKKIDRLIDQAEECMYGGILFCIAGFVLTLSNSSSSADHTRADALIGTFVGIAAARLLAFQHRWLHRLHDYVSGND